MKATEQFFPVVLFVMLYKMVLGFESVDEIQSCAANEQYIVVVLIYVTAIILCKGVLAFESVHKILNFDHSHKSST